MEFIVNQTFFISASTRKNVGPKKMCEYYALTNSYNVDLIILYLPYRLQMNKISIPRGSLRIDPAYYESNENSLAQTSPSDIIEDPSTSPSQDIDDRLKTLKIQTKP